jgi:hypothetical protein
MGVTSTKNTHQGIYNGQTTIVTTSSAKSQVLPSQLHPAPLPFAIKCMIVSYLSLPTHVDMSYVSKEWYLVCNDRQSMPMNGCYKLTIVGGDDMSSMWLTRMAYYRASSLVLPNLTLNHTSITYLMNMKDHLRSLQIGSVSTNISTYLDTFKQLSNLSLLTSLTFTCALPHDLLSLIGTSFPNLLHFRQPSLTIALPTILELPSSLTSLDLRDARLSGDELRTLMLHMPSLRHLSVKFYAGKLEAWAPVYNSMTLTSICYLLDYISLDLFRPLCLPLLGCITSGAVRRRGFVAALTRAAPHLTRIDELHIDDEDPDIDVILTIALPSLKQLTHLNLTATTQRALPFISSISHCLVQLQLVITPSVTYNDLASLYRLTSLTLWWDTVATRDTCQGLVHSSFIHHASLPYITLMGEPDIVGQFIPFLHSVHPIDVATNKKKATSSPLTSSQMYIHVTCAESVYGWLDTHGILPSAIIWMHTSATSTHGSHSVDSNKSNQVETIIRQGVIYNRRPASPFTLL